jgi:hypothetical protein
MTSSRQISGLRKRRAKGTKKNSSKKRREPKTYEVEEVVAFKNGRAKIKWHGYKNLTWEPLDNLHKNLLSEPKDKKLWWGDADVFLVNRIVGQQHVSGELQYLVEWLAQEHCDSWVVAQNISPDVIATWVSRNTAEHREDLPEANFSVANRAYDDDKISNRPGKKSVNAMFCKAVSVLHHGRVMYLDAQTLNTTVNLIKGGIDGTLVPVNFNYEVVKHMMSRGLPNTVPYYGSMFQAVTHNNFPIKAMWTDYCSTFDGNPGCIPKDDIRLLFSKRNLTKVSILAFTFCLRDVRRTHLSHAQMITRIRNWIQKTARNFNYALSIEGKMTYFPAMLFLMYKCCDKK